MRKRFGDGVGCCLEKNGKSVIRSSGYMKGVRMGQGLLHYYPLSTEGREDIEDLCLGVGGCTGFFMKTSY